MLVWKASKFNTQCGNFKKISSKCTIFFSFFRSSQISHKVDVCVKRKQNNVENVSKMPSYGLTKENTTDDTTNTAARNAKNRPPLLRVSHYDEEGSVFY